MLWVLKQSCLKETFLLTTNTTHDTRSIHNFLFGRPSFSFQSYDTATSPSFCLTKDELRNLYIPDFDQEYIEPNKLIKGVRMPLILSISAINRL